MLIQSHSAAVSGNDCAPVNPTSVPPGQTRPQHSDEEEEEEEEEEGLRFYPEHKSWIDALQHCHNENSTLVQITNQTVQDAVNSVLQNKSGLDGGVWIGLERSIFGVNVPWQWISGERVKEPHWSSSAFDDPLNNHCGKVIQVEGSQEFKWLDEDCHKELPFICQDLNGKASP
ncbi:lithostathine-like [Epinephelus lanceolatus]